MRPTRSIKRPTKYDDFVETFPAKKTRKSDASFIEQKTPRRSGRVVAKCPKVKTPIFKRTSPRIQPKSIVKVKPTRTAVSLPNNTVARVNIRLNEGPKLRRSIVMETFSAFFLQTMISTGNKGKVRSKFGDRSTIQSRGERIWTMLLLNKDYPYFFRKNMSKINLPLYNKIVCTKDRFLIHDFFGFGCRLNSKTMNFLVKTRRVPLFDTLVARSYDDCNSSWSIPAKLCEMTVINIPSKIPFDFNIYNPYLFELKLVISVDSIEFALELLTKLNNCFPNLDYVHIVYFFAEPERKKLISNQLEDRLTDFALRIKKDQVGVSEFCQTFEEIVFTKYPKIIFKMEFIYNKLTTMTTQMKTMGLRRTQNAYILYKQGGNEITATKYNFTHDKEYPFKFEYHSL